MHCSPRIPGAAGAPEHPVVQSRPPPFDESLYKSLYKSFWNCEKPRIENFQWTKLILHRRVIKTKKTQIRNGVEMPITFNLFECNGVLLHYLLLSNCIEWCSVFCVKTGDIWGDGCGNKYEIWVDRRPMSSRPSISPYRTPPRA